MLKNLNSKVKILKKLKIRTFPYLTNKINIKYKKIEKYNKIISLYKINLNNYNFFKYIFNTKKIFKYKNLKKFIIFNYYNLFSLKYNKLNIILCNLGLSKTINQSNNLINHKFIFLNLKLIKFKNKLCLKNDIIQINNIKFNKYIIYKNLINLNIFFIIKNKNKFLFCFKDMKFKII